MWFGRVGNGHDGVLGVGTFGHVSVQRVVWSAAAGLVVDFYVSSSPSDLCELRSYPFLFFLTSSARARRSHGALSRRLDRNRVSPPIWWIMLSHSPSPESPFPSSRAVASAESRPRKPNPPIETLSAPPPAVEFDLAGISGCKFLFFNL